MKTSLTNNILALGLPGLVLQLLGLAISFGSTRNVGVPFILLSGTVFLAWSLGLYAMAKGRSPAWGLLGILSLVGVLALVSLRDHAHNSRDGWHA